MMDLMRRVNDELCYNRGLNFEGLTRYKQGPQ